MPLRITVPRQFHPPSSLLGRLLRRAARDARQAEALYLAVAVLLATALLIAGQWVWLGLVQDAGEAAALTYFAAQLATAALFAGGALWGWKPPIHVEADGPRLHLRQGTRALTLHTARLDGVERVSDLVYHRHWRRYAAVRVFVNRIPPEVLLLRTPGGPVALGLPEPEIDRIEAYLAAARAEAVGAELLRTARVA